MHVPRSFLEKSPLPITAVQHIALVLAYSHLPQVWSTPIASPNLSWKTGDAPSTNLYTIRRTFNVRVAAATCAAVSLTAALLAFYWFCRMEKRCRHRLIMLLIYGDMMKSTWIFLFALISMTRGTVKTYSSFCQATGFLVQYGAETSDYAVLVIAIHSALQVFRPSLSSQADGLYPYRHFVCAGAIFIPATMAGLAFVNPSWGYMSQGEFCSLPIRPFWYRLTLAWIPRYIIGIVILGLAVAIYAHVGFEFRAFSRVNARSSVTTSSHMLSARDVEQGTTSDSQHSAVRIDERYGEPEPRSSSVAHDIMAPRSASAVPSSFICLHDSHPEIVHISGRSQSLPTSSSQNDGLASPATTRNSLSNLRPTRPSLQNSIPEGSYITIGSRNTSPLSGSPTMHSQRHMKRQRARIHRQLRLLFIYPLVYILMWIIPFVNHCLQYQDRYAQNPIYSLSLVSDICVCLMGSVDCLIFTLRERPWRHIPDSDGTFFGSFMFWSRPPDTNEESIRTTEAVLSEFGGSRREDSVTGASQHTPHLDPLADRAFLSTIQSLNFSVPRIKSSNRTSRSSDQQKVAKHLARLRLEYEKEERRAAHIEKEKKAKERDDAQEEVEGRLEDSESERSEKGASSQSKEEDST